MFKRWALHLAPPLFAVWLAGCAGTPAVAPTPDSLPPAPQSCPIAKPCPVCPVCPGTPPERPPAKPLEAADWSELPGWPDDDLRPALSAFIESCKALDKQPRWASVCREARNKPSAEQLRDFFERWLRPFRVVNPDGSGEGMITGYYEPLLKGSRNRGPGFRNPIYGVPDDLLVIDLAEVNPDLRNMRLRGRIEGRKVVPYYSRAELDARGERLPAKVLLWAADAVELFFLQVQGSGRVELPDGSMVRVGYADQNGHPYRSIGRWLVDQGELKLEQASMEGIKAWGRANPSRLSDLLNVNPSYVFFRELPSHSGGPLGALGVPLTEGRSIAVDPRVIPLGAPVFLATTWPLSERPLQRLMMAQDTGGAIRGAVRADFFWGFGSAAGTQAGRMRQNGRMWVLLPRETP